MYLFVLCLLSCCFSLVVVVQLSLVVFVVTFYICLHHCLFYCFFVVCLAKTTKQLKHWICVVLNCDS